MLHRHCYMACCSRSIAVIVPFDCSHRGNVQSHQHQNLCFLKATEKHKCGWCVDVQSRRRLLQTRQLMQSSPPPPPPPSQEEQTLEQILAAVTTLQTGQTTLQTDIDALQVQVDAANAAATVSYCSSFQRCKSGKHEICQQCTTC